MSETRAVGRFLPEMTWIEARDTFARGAVGLLPIGAVEAHGPHLPLGTDVMLSFELVNRVAVALAADVETVALPPIIFSVAECAASFPGSISVPPGAFREILRSVLESLGRGGLRFVALLNNHLEPEHVAALADAARGIASPRVLFADHTRKPWALLLDDEFKSGDCHAGGYETSLLLASSGHARHVREDVARSLPAVTIDLVRKLRAGERSFPAMGATEAYCGEPATATAEHGEALWAALVRMWTETIREALR